MLVLVLSGVTMDGACLPVLWGAVIHLHRSPKFALAAADGNAPEQPFVLLYLMRGSGGMNTQKHLNKILLTKLHGVEGKTAEALKCL